jgi:transposase
VPADPAPGHDHRIAVVQFGQQPRLPQYSHHPIWPSHRARVGARAAKFCASHVKAYVKRSKNDANDAAAICEALTRPSMRFVPIKTRDQQTLVLS